MGSEGPLPCVYSMHGGGYVIGSYTMDDPLFDELCPKLGCVGVSVDYRLAPETPYPGPLEDCYRGLRWTYDHADELGIDPRPDRRHGRERRRRSGGGARADRTRPRRGPARVPAPRLADARRPPDRPPRAGRTGSPVWSRSRTRSGGGVPRRALRPRRRPRNRRSARATDLSGLPPAYVSVGAVDGFRDEEVDYALRLNQPGVPTERTTRSSVPGRCPTRTRSRRSSTSWSGRRSSGGRGSKSGASSSCPRTGSFFTKEIAAANTSIIVVRDGDDVRAFHNVCRHRGNKLVWQDFPREETSGTSRQFTCKYHGWRYGLDGACTFVQQEGEFFDLDKADYGLVPVHCDVFAGFIFVNFAKEPSQTLRDFLGPMLLALEDYPFDEMTDRYDFRAESRQLEGLLGRLHGVLPRTRGARRPASGPTSTTEMGFEAPHYQIDGPHGVVTTAGSCTVVMARERQARRTP